MSNCRRLRRHLGWCRHLWCHLLRHGSWLLLRHRGRLLRHLWHLRCLRRLSLGWSHRRICIFTGIDHDPAKEPVHVTIVYLK